MAKEKIMKILNKISSSSTLLSILLGLFFGAIILWFSGFNPFKAYGILLQGIFSRPSYVAYTIIRSTPLILTGLSIAFAFRTGLFNIGAEGQFIVGAATATIVGYYFHLPFYIHIPLVIMLAMLASGIWGGLAGFLKSKYGINEVISTIMLNWIALYGQNFLTTIKGFAKPNSETSYSIQDSANTILFAKWKHTPEGISWLREHPFLKDLFRAPNNVGIFIAIIAAIVVWFILNKTTLGFKLRAVGFNKNAAEYGGISVKRSMVTSMFIAGSLAGLAGALHVIGVSGNIAVLAAMEGYGFDGIAVSLIASNSPLGCLWAGLLFGALKYGGTKLQLGIQAPYEIINIVIGVIVLFISMPKIIAIVKEKLNNKKDK